MAMPQQSLDIRTLEHRSVGAWLAVPQTQRGGVKSLGCLSRRILG